MYLTVGTRSTDTTQTSAWRRSNSRDTDMVVHEEVAHDVDIRKLAIDALT